MSENEAGRQADNIRPPRKSHIIALAVDATARAYDLSSLEMGGKNFNAGASLRDAIYLTLEAETADIYYYFDTATSSTLDDTAKVSAGGSLAYATTYAMRIPQNDTRDVRIERSTDKFLVVKTATGTATLRFYASSQPTIA